MGADSDSHIPPTSPAAPIAICPDYINPSPTMLIIKQCDPKIAQGDFLCFRPDASIILDVNTKKIDGSQRREFIDPKTSTPLFQLRRRYLNFSEMWYVELAISGEKVFSAAVIWKGWANIDVTITNQANGGSREQAQLEVRARVRKSHQLEYDVFLHGAKILEYRKIPARDAPGSAKLGGGPAWEVDIPAGVDLSLVSLLLVQLSMVSFVAGTTDTVTLETGFSYCPHPSGTESG